MKLITFVFCILFFNSAFSQTILLKTNAPFFDRADEYSEKSGYIKIDEVWLEVERANALETGGTRNTSLSYPELLHFNMPFGNSTISLFENMLNPRIGTNLEIIFTRSFSFDGPLFTYQTFQFDRFVIASVEPNGVESVDIAIRFSKVYIENFDNTEDPNRPLGSKTSYGWDYETQKEWAGF